ncbi:acyltransferase family protein [Methylovulum psychrotolerans]|uniref:Acyltransferase 3 domain-containing protein n=1 Tax=Methylovulum psychrotolerans TaxID=1704499 RepID=A0A2S5CMU5_9GAMM|nr:acyltransferase [Methylovulum psychrotolerans]POZ52104.1 hypothetical protein AADEFJLK_02326 [Methylovulum psychrotolerans]
MTAKQCHFYWLDWVRFIAAFMVVAIHARGGVWLDWGRLQAGSRTLLSAIFFAVTRAGTEWVLVFFILSGFLVGGKLIERLENNTFDLRVYMIDRITRIWVPLLPAHIWAAYVAYMAEKSLSWRELFGSLIGLQGIFTRAFAENYPLWSLAYEIWFYFLGGCLAIWLRSASRLRILAGFGIVVGMAIFTQLNVVFLFAWILGASTYWMCHEKSNTGLGVLGCFLIVVGFALSQVRSASVSVDLSAWLQYVPSSNVAMLVLSLGIALVFPILTQLRPKSKFGGQINAVGGKFAAFSYTLYLTHYPSLYLWEHYMPGRYDAIDCQSALWYGLRIVSCLILGWLFYLPFERQTPQVRNVLMSIKYGNQKM